MSLRSVTSWACANFKDDYQKIPKRKDYVTRTVRIPDQASSEADLKAIVIGSAVEEIRPYFRATVEVMAWVKGNRVETGYAMQIGDNVNVATYEDITKGDITFNEPFSWIMQAGGETAARRFEALINHAAMLTGSKRTIDSGYYHDFREHFPGACHDIAEMALQRLAEWRRITKHFC